MTIAQELTELAVWLDEQGKAWHSIATKLGIGADFPQDYPRKAAEVRALVAKCDGHVLTEPCVVGSAEGGYATFIHDGDVQHTGNGATPEAAVANLQALIDGTTEEVT